MDEFEKRFKSAVSTNADPRVVSPQGTWFAWYPVCGWDNRSRRHKMLWLEKVIWFRALCLLTEYQSYSGSEKEFYDTNGKYSWE